MLHHYADIRKRIAEEPRWFDEHGVPRYGDFAPGEVADVYCDEAVLVLIACQNCQAEFRVAFSRSRHSIRFVLNRAEYHSLADDIRSGRIHYGDPPNAGCCPAGPTMNCDDLRVLEYWHRDRFDWTRDAALEIALDD